MKECRMQASCYHIMWCIHLHANTTHTYIPYVYISISLNLNVYAFPYARTCLFYTAFISAVYYQQHTSGGFSFVCCQINKKSHNKNCKCVCVCVLGFLSTASSIDLIRCSILKCQRHVYECMSVCSCLFVFILFRQNLLYASTCCTLSLLIQPGGHPPLTPITAAWGV